MGLEAIGAIHAAYVEVLENESSLQKGVKIVRLTVPVSGTIAREWTRLQFLSMDRCHLSAISSQREEAPYACTAMGRIRFHSSRRRVAGIWPPEGFKLLLRFTVVMRRTVQANNIRATIQQSTW